jgi:DNA-binding FadR family transcriptional regulator
LLTRGTTNPRKTPSAQQTAPPDPNVLPRCESVDLMARLHRQKLLVLLDEIASEGFMAGHMLPREVDLQARFEVSRHVVREIIRALEERGVVSVRHGKGATVQPFTQWNVLDPIVATALLSGPHKHRLLLELTDCRALLEVGAARMAATRASTTALEEITSGVDRLDSIARRSYAERGEAEVAVHRAIVTAAANATLQRMVQPALDATQVAAEMLGRRSPTLAEHRRIAAALGHRDANEAAAAMHQHFEALGRDLRRST